MARVQLRHPEPGRRAPRIDSAMYEAVRAAILAALPREGEGLAFSRLAAEVERRTPPQLWKERSIGWFTTAVKLDLEARNLVERIPGAGPQRLRRVR